MKRAIVGFIIFFVAVGLTWYFADQQGSHAYARAAATGAKMEAINREVHAFHLTYKR